MQSDLKLSLLERIVADLREGRPLDYVLETYDRITALVQRPDGAVIVPLTQGQFALIDADDEPRVRQHKWFAVRDPNKRGCYYARAKIGGRVVPLHRFILQVDDPKLLVDHRSHDTLDCRKSMLRCADRFQSAQNRRSWESSKRTHRHGGSLYEGVYAVLKRNGELHGWQSVIKCRNVRYNIGTFKTPEEAALAYNTKAIELHGEFAQLNVIENVKS